MANTPASERAMPANWRLVDAVARPEGDVLIYASGRGQEAFHFVLAGDGVLIQVLKLDSSGERTDWTQRLR